MVYTLKTPYRDGTTQVAFEPVDFIAGLAALVPKPRVNLTRYHGVLAPNHRSQDSRIALMIRAKISRQVAKSDNDDRCGLHRRSRFNTLVLQRFMGADGFRGRWASNKQLTTE